MELVGTYYNPKPSVTVQRHKFYTRAQQPGENVAAFQCGRAEAAV